MIVRELLTTWGFDVDFSKLNKMDKKIAQISKGVGKLGRQFAQTSKKAREFGLRGSLFISAPLAALGVSILRTSGNFEKGMNRVNALTQATGEEFKKLKDQAKNLGATTQFTAVESADAMAFLAQAGLSTTDIFNAMPDALNLAGAAQIDFATTADIVTNVMTGMGIKSENLGSVVDILTNTFISSNTNLKQLGQAMKFAGSIARGFNIGLTDTVAILGSMGNAGIQAEMAGTALRGSLQRLGSPTKEAQGILKKLGVQTLDSAGKFRNLLDILSDLEKAGITTAQSFELFGARAGSGISVLIQNGIDRVREFSKKLESSGGIAKKLNDDQLKGLNGAIKKLVSRYEALKIAIGNAGLLEFATDTVKAITKLVNWFGNLSETTLNIMLIFGGLVAVLFPLIFLFGTLGFAVIGLSGAYTVLATVLTLVKLKATQMQAAFLIVPIMIALAIVAVVLFIDELIKWGASQDTLIGRVLGNWENFKTQFKLMITSIVDYFSKKGEALQRIMRKMFAPLAELGKKMIAPFDGVIKTIDNLITMMENKFPAIKVVTDKIGKLFSGLNSFIFGSDEANQPTTPEAVAQAASVPVTTAGLTNNSSSKNITINSNSNTELTFSNNGLTPTEDVAKAEEMLNAIEDRRMRAMKTEFAASP